LDLGANNNNKGKEVKRKMIQMDEIARLARSLVAEIHQRIVRQTLQVEEIQKIVKTHLSRINGHQVRIGDLEEKVDRRKRITVAHSKQIRNLEKQMELATRRIQELQDKVVKLENLILAKMAAHTDSRVADLRAIWERMEKIQTQVDAAR
jgi:DNA repair ATPase RecN